VRARRGLVKKKGRESEGKVKGGKEEKERESKKEG
jgi:hypothetical protein